MPPVREHALGAATPKVTSRAVSVPIEVVARGHRYDVRQVVARGIARREGNTELRKVELVVVPSFVPRRRDDEHTVVAGPTKSLALKLRPHGSTETHVDDVRAVVDRVDDRLEGGPERKPVLVSG